MYLHHKPEKMKETDFKKPSRKIPGCFVLGLELRAEKGGP